MTRHKEGERSMDNVIVNYMRSAEGWTDLHVICKSIDITPKRFGGMVKYNENIERRKVIPGGRVQYRWID